MHQGPQLEAQSRLFVQQRFEIAEWLGFETRNKYAILDQQERQIGFAAEQGRGFLGLLMRQFLGHLRTFEILFYTADRQLFLRALHPFRFYFHRLEIADSVTGRNLGAMQRRFALLHKTFDVSNAQGQVILEVSSPLWKPWTFPFKRQGREVACIRKKWSGVFFEAMTDKDRFMIEYSEGGMKEDERRLILAAALFIDLLYFEVKARS